MDKKAAIYTRVASSDGEERLAEQESACRRYCEEQGWDAIVFDEGVAPGFDMARPRLNALRVAAAAGEIQAVVVADVTRLSRRGPDCLRLWKEFQRAGVEVHTVQQGCLGDLEAMMMMLIAEHEQEMAGVRTARAFVQRAQAGSVIVSNKPPYGYRKVRQDDLIRLVIDEEEARIIRLIYEWYTQGVDGSKPLGASRIAQRLTALGIPSRRDRQSQTGDPRGWRTSSVSGILTNETYTGTWYYRKTDRSGPHRLRRPREEQVPVEVPAIIRWETWEAARRQSQENFTRSRTRKTSRDPEPGGES